MKKTVWEISNFLVIVLTAAVLLCSPAAAFEVKLTGQVNQMAMLADDGDRSDLFITDNDNSSTRLRLTGEENMGRFTIGAIIEFEGQRNASNTLVIDSGSDGNFDWNDRWIEAYLTTDYGQLEIGKGDGAANNTSEVDLSGTNIILRTRTNATSQALVWKDSTGAAYRGGLTVGDTRDNFDGLSRNERLRYNSPQFFGIGISASVTNGKAYEIGAVYSVDLFGKLAAAMGYADTQDRGTSEYTQLGLSASWLSSFGLNITTAMGIRNFQGDTRAAREAAGDTDNSTNFYLKVGYKWDIHAVAIEYGFTNDLNRRDDRSSNIGIGYVLTPWENVEVYAAIRQFMLDANTGDDPSDIRQFMAGTRVKF